MHARTAFAEGNENQASEVMEIVREKTENKRQQEEHQQMPKAGVRAIKSRDMIVAFFKENCM